MAASTANRVNTPERSGDNREPPVKAATIIYAGTMVAIDATSLAVPAAAVAAHRVIGRAQDLADNSAGAAGDIRVKARAGIFRFDNSVGAGEAIALKDIGQPAYVVDDHTVSLSSNSAARPVAGTIFDVDALGVWVKFS